jgi:RNA polymerase sigma factor (TIGR02999 family)
MAASDGDITRILASLRDGDPDALGSLFPIVYAELREIAHRQLAGHQRGTLSTTAVVHEAYLKLVGSETVDVGNRAHFFSLAARAMRQIMIDYARKRLAKKRGGGVPRDLLGDRAIAIEDRAGELLDLDRALERLMTLDERLGRLVELRFFAGLSVEETAVLLEVSPRTVKRDWQKARAFLYDDLHGGEAPAP